MTKKEAKFDIKEEIKKAMKELECVPDIAGLSYEDMYSSKFGRSRRVQDPKV